jgi:hypothetical protein
LNGLSLPPVSTPRTAAIAWIRPSSNAITPCFVDGHRLQNSVCNVNPGDGRQRISGAEVRIRANGGWEDLLRAAQGHRRPWRAQGAETRDNDRAPGDLTRRSWLEYDQTGFDESNTSSRLPLKPNLNTPRKTGLVLPPPAPRDSQAPQTQTAANMRLCGNQKTKPSRGEGRGRKRTGGRAATAAQTRC